MIAVPKLSDLTTMEWAHADMIVVVHSARGIPAGTVLALSPDEVSKMEIPQNIRKTPDAS